MRFFFFWYILLLVSSNGKMVGHIADLLISRGHLGPSNTLSFLLQGVQVFF